MADTKISALTAASAATAAQELPINDGGVSKKLTVDQLRDYYASIISGNSGNANPADPPNWTYQVLSTNATAATGTAMVTIMSTLALATTGIYTFRYDLAVQSATTGNSFRFNLNYSAAQSRILWRLYFPSAGVTAATGAVDQEGNATTGFVYGHFPTRTNNQTLGPQTGVDTANADIHLVIEGMLTATASGNLILSAASQTTGNTQIMAGSILQLLRLI
jgi:hypothetical protein